MILVNPDAHVPSGGWTGLRDFLEAASTRAIAVPRLVNPDGSVQNSFFLSPSCWQEIALTFGGARLAAVVARLRSIVGAKPCHVSGAFFICHRKVWDSVGGFDEQFFLYAEETDFCVRAAAQGVHFQHCPELVLVHNGSQGLESKTETTFRHLLQSKLKYFEKHKGIWSAMAVFWAWRLAFRFKTGAILAWRYGGRRSKKARLMRVLRGCSYRDFMSLRTTVSRSNRTSLLVYDPDGINPYGRELAADLRTRGHHITALIPVDAAWCPLPPARVRRALPGNQKGRSKLTQGYLMARAQAMLLGRALFRKEVVLAVWTRMLLDAVVLALLAAARRPVIVIEHNPTPRTHLNFVRSAVRKYLLRRCTAVVAHSQELAADIARNVGRRDVAVCSHIPYVRWVEDFVNCHYRPRGTNETRDVRVLLLGQLRPDKGIGALPQIFQHLSPALRRRVILVVCGRGTLSKRLATDIRRLGVRVEDLSSPEFISDEAVGRALAGSNLLLAPYSSATQSGTVIMALTAGLRVVAFDKGALASVLDPSGLVAGQDHSEFASALRRDRKSVV